MASKISLKNIFEMKLSPSNPTRVLPDAGMPTVEAVGVGDMPPKMPQEAVRDRGRTLLQEALHPLLVGLVQICKHLRSSRRF